MLKKSKLEIIVLSIGALVILSALFLRFFAELNPKSHLIVTNIVFALGFLIYILYSMLSTNNLNKEIQSLNEKMSSLEVKLDEKEKLLQERNKKITALEDQKKTLEQEKSTIEEELSAGKEEIAALEKQISELRTSKKKKANP